MISEAKLSKQGVLIVITCGVSYLKPLSKTNGRGVGDEKDTSKKKRSATKNADKRKKKVKAMYE